ncbi:YqaJ viral recombinase family protein [Clostridium uliginosum]|uniref:Putative phage-type endonuclease n=1 Tax=Clostridium uliginosum TaxID=119641 RepID=A0A1I1NNZ1_9CLOT|nr:YqaJ viral recombinase family protein [Clostridium uliginosum]SFC99359.1 putative phage-type endonuclease [Clostridium uliginosum]
MSKLSEIKECQKGILGSDVGAIMGVDKVKSVIDVYREKTEDVKEADENGEVTYWYSTLEEIVSREFALRTGKKVRKDKRTTAGRDCNFMIGNVDRKVVSENSILECMVVNHVEGNEWRKYEVPPKHLVEAQHDMEVRGADKCYIAALIDNSKFIIHEVERDDELISKIVEKEREFWINHVAKKIPPKFS